jgi:HK97 family phage prohead protease
MTDTLTRTFAPDLAVRSTGDGRTIEGIAVPYGVRVHIPYEGIHEQFARGAFNHQLSAPQRVRLGREHPSLGGQVIGLATELRDDARGLFASFRVSKTQAGDETLELARDGVLDEFSVGFRSRQDRRLSDGTVERTKADLIETSIVFQGAYGRGATVTAVRSGLCAQCGEHLTETPDAQPLARMAEAAQLLARIPMLPS